MPLPGIQPERRGGAVGRLQVGQEIIGGLLDPVDIFLTHLFFGQFVDGVLQAFELANDFRLDLAFPQLIVKIQNGVDTTFDAQTHMLGLVIFSGAAEQCGPWLLDQSGPLSLARDCFTDPTAAASPGGRLRIRAVLVPCPPA